VREKGWDEWEVNYYNEINFGLRNAGLPIRYLGNGAGSLRANANDKIVNLITYHSAKGLDFEVTFLPFLTKERLIPSGGVPAENLFFVALTRAREQMFLSYNSGNPHRFLNMIDRSCLETTTAAEDLAKSQNSYSNPF
jgi:superfamily I DNA/RNA helicase